MTDNEIIKALECCNYPIQVCNECPIPNDIRDNCKCMETLCENALDLIKRQKAEIEMWKEKLNHSIGVDNTKENGYFPFD